MESRENQSNVEKSLDEFLKTEIDGINRLHSIIKHFFVQVSPGKYSFKKSAIFNKNGGAQNKNSLSRNSAEQDTILKKLEAFLQPYLDLYLVGTDFISEMRELETAEKLKKIVSYMSDKAIRMLDFEFQITSTSVEFENFLNIFKIDELIDIKNEQDISYNKNIYALCSSAFQRSAYRKNAYEGIIDALVKEIEIPNNLISKPEVVSRLENEPDFKKTLKEQLSKKIKMNPDGTNLKNKKTSSLKMPNNKLTAEETIIEELIINIDSLLSTVSAQHGLRELPEKLSIVDALTKYSRKLIDNVKSINLIPQKEASDIYHNPNLPFLFALEILNRNRLEGIVRIDGKNLIMRIMNHYTKVYSKKNELIQNLALLLIRYPHAISEAGTSWFKLSKTDKDIEVFQTALKLAIEHLSKEALQDKKPHKVSIKSLWNMAHNSPDTSDKEFLLLQTKTAHRELPIQSSLGLFTRDEGIDSKLIIKTINYYNLLGECFENGRTNFDKLWETLANAKKENITLTLSDNQIKCICTGEENKQTFASLQNAINNLYIIDSIHIESIFIHSRSILGVRNKNMYTNESQSKKFLEYLKNLYKKSVAFTLNEIPTDPIEISKLIQSDLDTARFTSSQNITLCLNRWLYLMEKKFEALDFRSASIIDSVLQKLAPGVINNNKHVFVNYYNIDAIRSFMTSLNMNQTLLNEAKQHSDFKPPISWSDQEPLTPILDSFKPATIPHPPLIEYRPFKLHEVSKILIPSTLISTQDKLRNHYQQLLNDIPPNKDHLPANWTYQYDDTLKIHTYTFSDPTKKDPRVGSDGNFIVKVLDEDAYDFIKTHDFIDRLNLMFETTEYAISGMQESQAKERFKAWLKERKAASVDAIKQKCIINNNNMMNDFEGAYKNAMAIFASTNTDIMKQYQEDFPASPPLNLKKLENEYLAQKGRPALVKIIHHQSKKFLSADFPQNSTTIPSNIRARDLNDKVLLSKHIMHLTGYVNNDNKLIVQTAFDGHSSYPPIGVKDKSLRLHLTKLAILEKLAAIAQRTKSDINGTAENPLEISQSSILMLSPLNKLAGGVQDKPEKPQLEFVHYAVGMLQHTNQTIRLPDGTYIKLDFSMMNVPVNMNPVTNVIAADQQLIDSVNLKGFCEYVDRIEQYLIDHNFSLSNILLGQREHLDKYYRIIDANNPLLAAQFSLLDEKLEVYALANDKNKKMLETEIRKIKNAINAIQNKNNDAYASIAQAKRSYLDTAFKSSSEIDAIRDKLQDTSIPQKDKETELLALRFFQSQRAYFDKHNNILNSPKRYEFHVLYVLNNQQIGRTVEGFCKSGKDRTGWLQIELEAYQAFHQLHGRDPNFDEPKEVETYRNLQEKFAMSSTAVDAAQYDGSGRGLQVDANKTHPIMKYSRTMGEMVKHTYSIPGIPTPMKFNYPEETAPPPNKPPHSTLNRDRSLSRHSFLNPRETSQTADFIILEQKINEMLAMSFRIQKQVGRILGAPTPDADKYLEQYAHRRSMKGLGS